MSMYIGHITVAGIVTFSAVFLAVTLVAGIIYAGVIAFSGGEFRTDFFKFMVVLYAVVLAALIFGLVDLPCSLSFLPSIPNGWQDGCPIYNPNPTGL